MRTSPRKRPRKQTPPLQPTTADWYAIELEDLPFEIEDDETAYALCHAAHCANPSIRHFVLTRFGEVVGEVVITPPEH
jgi:hypothetical protein